MDILNILQTEWPLITAAPVLAIGGALILVTAAFILGWKLKSVIDAGEFQARDAWVKASAERLQLASDREQAARKASEELEKRVQELKAQIAAGASRDALAPATARVDSALGIFRSANTELRKALVTVNGKPAKYVKQGDHLVIEPPDGGPAIVVPDRPRDAGY